MSISWMKPVLGITLLMLIPDCYYQRNGSHHPEGATITLANDWDEEGEEEVMFLQEGIIQLVVPFGDKGILQCAQSASMRRYALSFSGSGKHIEFFAAVRGGHRYTIRYSPCCFLHMEDREDDPYAFEGDTLFTDSSGNCPDSMIPLFPGLAEDPEGKHRCVPAPRMRFKYTQKAADGSPVEVRIGEGIGNEPIPVNGNNVSGFYTFDIVRSGTPSKVRLIRNNDVLWEGMVIFRVKHAYTLEYDPARAHPVSIMLDD
jgi:hypothetical protein